MHNDLFRVPNHIQTHWASAENWRGKKGAAVLPENRYLTLEKLLCLYGGEL
jgi:hypothetical protein